MRKAIHHLRKQPEEVRRHILHVLTMVAGVILIMLWVYSLGRNFGSSEIRTEVEEGLKPISVLKDNIVLPSW